MLRGLWNPLLQQGTNLTLLSRSATTLPLPLIGVGHPPIIGLDANWGVPGQVGDATDQAIDQMGPITAVIAWVHAGGEGACEEVANRLDPSAAVTWWDIWGSAAGSPSSRIQPRVAGRPNLDQRSIILGWISGASGSRWLAHREIVAGVLEALNSDQQSVVVGKIRPWEARP